jgi:hypothetical protein
MVVKCISCFKIQDSSSKIRDMNANTESEMPGGQSVGIQGEAACIQIPHLDLKNVSDGDKWEGNFIHTHYFPDMVFVIDITQRSNEILPSVEQPYSS